MVSLQIVSNSLPLYSSGALGKIVSNITFQSQGVSSELKEDLIPLQIQSASSKIRTMESYFHVISQNCVFVAEEIHQESSRIDFWHLQQTEVKAVLL